MSHWQTYVGLALGVVVLGAALSLTAAGPALAQGALKPVMALIVNDSSQPVPVTVATPLTVTVESPVVTTPPLWQGTPTVEVEGVLQQNASGFRYCEQALQADAGKAVLLNTITVAFNVPPGSWGSASVNFTLPDGFKTLTLDVPTHRTAGTPSGAVIKDQWSGSLDLNGFPVIAAEACVFGINAQATFGFIGFTVPLPN